MKFSGLSRGLFTFAAFVVFVAGLRAASSVIVPFLLACFIGLITFPIMTWLRRKGIRPGFAVLLIMIALLGLIYGFVQISGNSINKFVENSTEYQVKLQAISRGWVEWLRENDIEINSETFSSVINPANLMRGVVNTLNAFVLGLLTNTFMIMVTVVFLLFELSGLPNKLRIALGEDHASIPAMDRFTAALNRYLAIKSVISLLTGLLAYLLCTFLRIDFALLWGLLAFLLNYVPNIGSMIAAVPPVMLALVQFGTGRAIICAIGYVVINVSFGNFIEPRVMGKGLGLSTLVVWMSLLFWGWVFGPIGMLLSIPLTMIVKIAMESREDTQWLAILLGSDPGEPTLESPEE